MSDVTFKNETDVEFQDGDVVWADDTQTVTLSLLSIAHDFYTNRFTEAWQAFDDSGGSAFDDLGGSVFDDFGGLWFTIEIGALGVQDSSVDLVSDETARFPLDVSINSLGSLSDIFAETTQVKFHIYASVENAYHDLLIGPLSTLVSRTASASDGYFTLTSGHATISSFDVGLSVYNTINSLLSDNVFVELSDLILLIVDYAKHDALLSDNNLSIDRMMSVDSLVNDLLSIHDTFILKNRTLSVDSVVNSSLAGKANVSLGKLSAINNSVSDLSGIVDLLLLKKLFVDKSICDLFSDLGLSLDTTKYINPNKSAHNLLADNDLSLLWSVLFAVQNTVNDNISADINSVYNQMLEINSALNDTEIGILGLSLDNGLDILNAYHDAITDIALLYITGAVEIVLHDTVNSVYSDVVSYSLSTSVNVDGTQDDLVSGHNDLILQQFLSVDKALNINISSYGPLALDQLLFVDKSEHDTTVGDISNAINKYLSVDKAENDLFARIIGIVEHNLNTISVLDTVHENDSLNSVLLLSIIQVAKSSLNGLYSSYKNLLMGRFLLIDSTEHHLLTNVVLAIYRNRFITDVIETVHALLSSGASVTYDTKPLTQNVVCDLLSSSDNFLYVAGYPIVYLDDAFNNTYAGKNDLYLNILSDGIEGTAHDIFTDLVAQRSNRIANANSAGHDLNADDMAWLKALWLITQDSTIDHISKYARIWDTGVFALYNYIARSSNYVFIARNFDDKMFK